MKLADLTFDEINEAIAYDPEAGVFTWKLNVSRNVKANSVAGTFKNCRHRTTGQVKSYLYIRYKDREMVGSRIAWLLQTGSWPSQSVMFEDGNTKNLQWKNLKLSSFKSGSKIIDGRRSYRMSKEAQRHYGLKRYYGMSISDYAEMYRMQDGKCAICHQPELSKDRHRNVRVLAVDHCHRTGVVRELLCYSCNSMLGQARDNAEILSAGIAYLNKHSSDKSDKHSDPEGHPSVRSLN